MTSELHDDYAQAGFGDRLGFGKRPALLIVDFVQAYLDKSCSMYAGVEQALAAAVELLGAARASGIPILHTNIEYAPGFEDGGIFYRKTKALENFKQGSPMGAFAAGLEPLAHELVITKQYPSAFFGTSLASTLTSSGIDSVIIAGLSTSGCVRASTLDAMQYGFIPIVVREAVGDRDPAPHEASLFDLQAKYADVVSLTEVKKYLAKLKLR